jgi:serine/threonine-protein kinase
MATVHFGRLLGPVGFSRTVAIKRLHAQYASDPEFVSMFLDEARLAARIRHPNVVPTLDVVAIEGELFLVMEYVAGESLAKLTRNQRERPPTVRIISSVMAGTLHGLHAAHEATDERGSPLGIVHRDVSPQNILVGTDGIPKILDFGVAKAAGRTQHTREGQIKGKLSYMPPEQLRGGNVTRQADVYAAGIVLWEMITGQRLFGGDNEGVVIAKILEGRVTRPSQVITTNMKGTLTDRSLRDMEALDAVVLRALSMNPEARFATAQEMAIELERTVQPATAFEVKEWVQAVARDVLATRANKVSEIESSSGGVDHDKVISALSAQKSTVMSPHLQAAMAQQSYGPPALGGQGSHASTARMSVDPPVTQPSTISVSTGARSAEQVRQRRTVAGAAISVVLLLLALVAGVSAWRIRSHSVATASDVVAGPSALAGTTAPVVPSLPTMPTAASTIVTPQGGAVGINPGTSVGTSPAADADTRDAGPSPQVIATQQTKRPYPQGGAATARPTAAPPPPAPPATSAPKPSTADPCNPPYYYDAKGVKHYKEQCI